jgi:N,N'-diacetyllegionaminate synthase
MSTFIIAEAGVNHNGSLSTAKLLVDKAKESGADCIKFQTFISKNIVTKNAGKAEYQKQQTDSNESQLDMLRKLELSFDDFIELNNYCLQKDIEFLSTAFDFESIDFLNSLNMKRWKIPSGDITNLPYLVKIAKLNRPIILSTGMSTMDEVRFALNTFKNNGNSDITVLHCTTEYPAPYQAVNLKAMLTMKNEFNIPVGYSDHTRGIEIPIAAVAVGATVVEKHFTLDRTMEGPDHKASLEPDELKTMVSAIRNIEVAMGSGEKIPSESEKGNMVVARKSIIAKTNIKIGDTFTEQNITVKRPGYGLSPMRWFDVLGQKSKRNFEEDELIEL